MAATPPRIPPIPSVNLAGHFDGDPASPSLVEATIGPAVLRKVTGRLIPFLFLLYVVNIIDRANVGFAKLTMLDDLGMSEKAYGFGAGIFYVGYILFEVPSNLILARTGARKWIARILISWGIVTSGMMFVTGPISFYALRVLLGIAEAGFFPGIIFFLYHWFPARARAQAIATFMTAGVMASIVGSPLAGLILDQLNGAAGLAGWKWLFLLEGIPAVLLGFVTLAYLTDRPEQASWLEPAERQWLVAELAAEQRATTDRHSRDLWAALLNPKVWLLIGVYFSVALGDNAYGFYAPSFLQEMLPEWSKTELGLLLMVPGLVAITVMVLLARHSDRTHERRWHVAIAAFFAAAGWLVMSQAGQPWVFFVGLVMALTGMKSMLPTFWAIPSSFLSGTAAAGGIALINSMANIGGFLAPSITGQIKTLTNSYTAVFLMLATGLVVGGLLVLQARSKPRHT